MIKRAIWKYTLTDRDCTLAMPIGAKFRHFQLQKGEPCIWMEVNPDNPMMDRRFVAYGTGEEFDPRGKEFVATLLTDAGDFVWHLYEVDRDSA